MNSATTVRIATATTGIKIANFLIFQISWFAAVSSAAHGLPLLGLVAVALAVAWHLLIAADWRQEARLVAIVTVAGLAFETLRLRLEDVTYASGQPSAAFPPYWLAALWSLFATTLNVCLRWMRGRPVLAALFGLVGGPLAFAAGVRLGAARFVDFSIAILTLGAGWAVLMPILLRIAERYDGFSRSGNGDV